jgi:hypothetical protein
MLAHADPPVGTYGFENVTDSAGESFAAGLETDIVAADKKPGLPS